MLTTANEQILQAVLPKINTNFNDSFSLNGNSEYPIENIVNNSNSINRTKKHLRIRCTAYGQVLDTWYRINNGKTHTILRLQYGSMDAIGDTLMDVNGDGVNDFCRLSYSGAGCCLRNVYDVFLYNSKIDSFGMEYGFMNPTFYPTEKTIRGILYGPPGEAGLYKYKWSNNRIDTLEFIYPNPHRPGSYLKTQKPIDVNEDSTGLMLLSLPKEYNTVNDLDYFLAY